MQLPRVKALDFIGFCGYEPISLAINLGTGGLPPWCGISHIGVIAELDREQELWECTTLSDLPCLLQGKCVQGTQVVRLADRIARYHGRVYHYPLYRPLYADESRRLTDFLMSRIGQPYDRREAFESGGWFGIMAMCASTMRVKPSTRSWFCSKESAACTSYCGICPTTDAARWSPNRFIRHLRRRELILPRVRLK
jgi:hypothetical protein